MRIANKATEEQKTKPRILLIIGADHSPDQTAKLRKLARQNNVTLVDYNKPKEGDEGLLKPEKEYDIALTLAHGNGIGETHGIKLQKDSSKNSANFITRINAETHFFFSCDGGAARTEIEKKLGADRQVIIAAGTRRTTLLSDNTADIVNIITACSKPLSKSELQIQINELIAEGILGARTHTITMNKKGKISSVKYRGLLRGDAAFLESSSQALGKPEKIEELKTFIKKYCKENQGSKKHVSEGSNPKNACKITFEGEEKKEEKEKDYPFAEIDQAIGKNIESWDEGRVKRFLQDSLWQASFRGKVAVVKALIAAKADVYFQDINSGATALMTAAGSGHVAVVKALVVAGANVHLENKHGYPALDIATKHNQGECIKLLESFKKLEELLNTGYKCNKKTARQYNLSNIIARSNESLLLNEIITSFVNKICEVRDGKDEKEVKLNPGMVELFMRRMQPKIRKLMGVIVQAANSPFRTKILENFTEQQQDVLIKEITRCAHEDVTKIPRSRNNNGSNIWEIIPAKGKLFSVKQATSSEDQAKLDGGIILEVQKGNVLMVALLIEKGGDVHVKRSLPAGEIKQGEENPPMTVLAHAVKFEQVEIVELLLNHARALDKKLPQGASQKKNLAKMLGGLGLLHSGREEIETLLADAKKEIKSPVKPNPTVLGPWTFRTTNPTPTLASPLPRTP
jgi:hypothetical protein